MKDEIKPSRNEQTEKTNYQNWMKTPIGRKGTLTKGSVKRYRVTISFIEVTDEERKIKRGIIEDIMKNL